MRFSLFTDNGALNSPKIFDALETSLRNAGHDIVHNDMEADAAVIWSVLWNGRMKPNKKVFDKFQAKGKPVFVLEVGSIKRGKTWKLGLNGVNKKNYPYLQYIDKDMDRAEKFGLELKDWTHTGDKILIACQHGKSQQWEGLMKPDDWIMRTVERIREHTDRPIALRPHPRAPISVHKFYSLVDELQEPKKLNAFDEFDLDFDNVWAVVNWSSSPAIHAITEGIPAYTGPRSITYPVANPIKDFSNINNPDRPDREEWFKDYIYSEFTVNELRNGYAWDLVSKGL